MGHYYTITLFGGEVPHINLTIVGATMPLPQNFSYQQEFFCAIAGPCTNLMVALFFSQLHWGHLFAGLNFALALLNLLPLEKLDGGRALHCLLHLFLPYEKAEQIRTAWDKFFTSFLLLLGVFTAIQGGSITLLILSLWLQKKKPITHPKHG